MIKRSAVFLALFLCMARAQALESMKDCEVCPEMVVLPTGEFMMGSNDKESSLPDEKPAQLVNIARPIAVGKFEVTFREWDACVVDGGCGKVDDEGWGRDTRPVINVDFEAAKTYARWLSRKTEKRFRLLTEAEWEYAARGGSNTAWYWGSIEEGIGLPTGCLYANTHDQTSKQTRPDYAWLAHPCDDGFTYTAPVGTFQPNAFGLFDMLGNVAEWVEDCNIPYKVAPTDGAAGIANECEKRVTRGGAWLHGPTWVRSAFRHPQPPGYANYTVGFRVARELP
ncbi:MAG: formylglycine-generating enzyme family protein [Burkholderiales bacterium]